MRGLRGRMVVLLVGAFLLGGWIVPHVNLTWKGTSAQASPPVDVAQINPEEVYARAAAVAAPSVVNIDTEKRVAVRGFFDDFFDSPRYRRVAGSGSGVIISSEGDVLTNEHVVAGADSIAVTLSNGRKYSGRVIGTDHSTDVALVKIDGASLPVAHLGTSRGLIPGQLTVAIGNPLGLRFTVTHGIVSALGRPIKIGDRSYENLIQTDCAINPGNSGGALADREGRIVGINTIVAEAANGVGFAIPIDTAMDIASKLKRFGKVKRPWTGIYAVANNRALQARYGLATAAGAFVGSVEPGSPADAAGIQPGDIIVELGGKKVADDDDLRHITESLRIGQTVSATVLRGDQEGRAQIIVREAP